MGHRLMELISTEVNRYSPDNWYCKLILRDKDGYKVTIERTGFNNRNEAEAALKAKMDKHEKK